MLQSAQLFLQLLIMQVQQRKSVLELVCNFNQFLVMLLQFGSGGAVLSLGVHVACLENLVWGALRFVRLLCVVQFLVLLKPLGNRSIKNEYA
ncbi:hypothetical protein GCWU000324_01505 [Kingella oralis ATCC 51147]|uniref:Uncharacterized protein n=1 Tax=Kingella oralis ATCC 51147 TaxID=629741 RepID=C4GKK2_9NEIS|nr:hypothetical protein GCWU000324_01505 [Kingella oralis ATCC 51147]